MTIWNQIGMNIRNGRLAQFTQAFGQASLGIGLTGAMIHDAKHSNCCSVFGNCYGFNNFGFMPNMINYPFMPNFNYNYTTSPMLTNMSANMAFQNGYEVARRAMEQLESQRTASLKGKSLPATNNEYAGNIDKNQSSEAGKNFDEGTTALIKDGEAVKDKVLDLNIDKDNYKSSMTELGKSYTAHLDTNKDGSVSADEFIEQEISKQLPSNATESVKIQARSMAQIAFNKMDQNGDKKLDYKELAATITTFDKKEVETDGKQQMSVDGKIESDNYLQWSVNLSNNQNTTFDTAVRKSYNFLFNPKK